MTLSTKKNSNRFFIVSHRRKKLLACDTEIKKTRDQTRGFYTQLDYETNKRNIRVTHLLHGFTTCFQQRPVVPEKYVSIIFF